MQQINVIKRDGTKELFDANKINAAILKACDGLPDQVSKVVQVATELQLTLIMVIPDTATALNMFENGEFDLVDVPSNLFKMYRDQGKAKLFYNGALDWIRVNVAKNPDRPWLSNKNFRKAMAWAIDRESYTATSTKGLYTPAFRFILPIVQGVKKQYDKEHPLPYVTLEPLKDLRGPEGQRRRVVSQPVRPPAGRLHPHQPDLREIGRAHV